MTQIAQKIDYQNRELQRKNQELVIRNSSQANDKELLMAQLIAEKKQTKERQRKLKRLKELTENLEPEGRGMTASASLIGEVSAGKPSTLHAARFGTPGREQALSFR